MSELVTDQVVLGWIQQGGIDLEIEESDFGTPLTDLGVDSLSLFEIMDMLEAKTGLAVSDADFKNLSSVAAMGRYIRARLNS